MSHKALVRHNLRRFKSVTGLEVLSGFRLNDNDFHGCHIRALSFFHRFSRWSTDSNFTAVLAGTAVITKFGISPAEHSSFVWFSPN